MVEGVAYCRYEGEHSQKQSHLGECNVYMILSWVMRGEVGRGELGNQESKRPEK